MKEVLKEFIKRNNLSLNNQTVCIGISTGVDSTVLLHLLLLLKDELNLNIILCHVNHKKREQSEIEEKYIIDFSKKHNLQLELLHLKLEEIENENFQKAARMQRLNFFNDIMNKHNSKYLFLAHHLNDDIETSLMHIIRGSSIKGYCGMEEVIKNKDNKFILRPLLTVLKEDIINYSIQNNIKYFEDESNNTDVYTRNRVRHNIIPLLFDENNSFDKQFLEFKKTLQYSYNLIISKRDEVINEVSQKEGSKIIIDIIKFKKIDNFLKEEVLFELLKQYELSKVNIKEIIKLIESSKPNLTTHYKNINFSKQYNRVIISNNESKNNKNGNKPINIVIDHLGTYDINDKYCLEVLPFSEEDYKKTKISLTNLDIIWYNNIMFPISLRNRKEGDRIKISSGTKKVKDLLIDEKIPLNERDNLLLLEKDNEILNIFGVKKSKMLLDSKNNNILIVLKEKK